MAAVAAAAVNENKLLFNGKTVGFIGAGNMAQAICLGMIKSGIIEGKQIKASSPTNSKSNGEMESFGVQITTNNKLVASTSNILVLAVKPHLVAPVLKEIRKVMLEGQLVISVAAGLSLLTLEKQMPPKMRVIRVMPNTPALVQCGVSAYSKGTYATTDDSKLVAAMLSSIGISEEIGEHLLDAVSGLSGSGPAYMFTALEALADGGVKMGLPRNTARRFAAQMMMGSAKMALESDKHTADLKDGVCSPGGTTICAMHELEKGGFRSSLIAAVEASARKCTELGKLHASD